MRLGSAASDPQPAPASGAAGSSDDPAPGKGHGKGVAKAKAKADSAAKRKASGVAKVNAVVKNSQNICHAATKLMLQPDRTEILRAVSDLALPILLEHHRVTSAEDNGVRSVENSIQYHIDNAEGEWMKTLAACWQKLWDPKVLKRSGMKVYLSPSALSKYKLGDPEVEIDNAIAGRNFRIVACIVSE